MELVQIVIDNAFLVAGTVVTILFSFVFALVFRKRPVPKDENTIDTMLFEETRKTKKQQTKQKSKKTKAEKVSSNTDLLFSGFN